MTVSALVPSSLTREAEDKREATRKLGYVARAATIFRVDRLIVYPDPGGETGRFDGGFVSTVLRYAATPPYLRTEAWGKRDELEYAGILPPLRATSQTGSESNGSGSSRQGIVTEVGPDHRVRVNCGLQHPISLNVPPEMAVEEGERVTVRISSRRPVRAKLVDEPLPGLSVERTDLQAALGREDAGVCIAASRFGDPLTVGRLETLAGRTERDGMTVAFGAPERGLPDILGIEASAIQASSSADGVEEPSAPEDGVEPTDHGFDLWLNTVPDQGSEVVRTEEALFATLASLSLRA
ncbi:putative RNA uridine N3 methyltransferase [Natrarchaeobaculum sulfurireducens]|uniref:Methylase n=1 Tax=Natrarchaeobaculum sulfurireducens TaxID=2044521 RepID=A0A346PSA6_9EURY|nr:RNA methyltransferase [Natrarchaeobaculum sulfurireducens]AXR82401.1 Methylase [Natrarchaeobaculum sulfurireducens]